MIFAAILIVGLVYSKPYESGCPLVREKYEQFLKLYQKPADRINDEARLRKFCDTLSFIDNHNSNAFSVSLNERADWLEEEMQLLLSNPPSSQSQGQFIEVDTESETLVPVSLDWATYNNKYGYPVVSLVQDQGLCGACWAFVSASAVHSSVKLSLAKERSTPEPVVPSLSPQQLIDCDRSMNNGCNGGSPFYAFQYIEMNGLVSSSDYPFKEKV